MGMASGECMLCQFVISKKRGADILASNLSAAIKQNVGGLKKAEQESMIDQLLAELATRDSMNLDKVQQQGQGTPPDVQGSRILVTPRSGTLSSPTPNSTQGQANSFGALLSSNAADIISGMRLSL